jgi:nicotinamidase-related amidase
VIAVATVREGSRAVLMVVDVQAGVMAECWDAQRVVGNIVALVGRARAQGIPVIWVRHSDAELVHGTPSWQWVPELVPAAGEASIEKHFNSAFEGTTLDDELARIGATQIVLAGAASNWCIRATAYAALDRGYDLTLVGDAHTTGTMQPDDGRAIEAADIVRELNVVMTWVRYPGRRSAVAGAGAVDFAATGSAGPA